MNMLAATKPISPVRALPSWIAPRPRVEAFASPLVALPAVPRMPSMTGPYHLPEQAAANATTPYGGTPAPWLDPEAMSGSAAARLSEQPEAHRAPASLRSGAGGLVDRALRESGMAPRSLSPNVAELAHQAEIAGLRSALAEAVAAATRVRREVLEASVPEVVKLATAIAEQVIGRKLSSDATLVPRLAREGIEAMLDQHDLVVAVSPDLAASIPPEAWSNALEGRAQVVTDVTLDSMRCEVRGAGTRVAVDPRARLEAVLATLGEGDEASR